MSEANNDGPTYDNTIYAELTAEVVSSYVGNNSVPAADLPGLIREVFATFHGLETAAPEGPKEELVPAVNPKRSVSRDYIICLEDGKKFKSLKRHLSTHYGMTPEEYREKWGLPADYPMVAPSYSEKRSNLAKEKGLGRKKGSRRNG